MLPIGDRFTMGPEHAARACALIKPEIVIPMHYNTFPPVEQNPEEFKSLVESICDTEVLICEPGRAQEV
jgi:L-ascorbate metabolism protein UlaG (beta-lactamase superfamily)